MALQGPQSLWIAAALCVAVASGCPRKDNPIWGIGGDSSSSTSPGTSGTTASSSGSSTTATSASTTDSTTDPSTTNATSGSTGEPEPTVGPFEGMTILPAPVSEDDSDEDDPTLSPDLLELVFVSDRGNRPDLYVARRSDPSEAFESVTVLSISDPNASDNTPRFSFDGRHLYFSSDRGGGMGMGGMDVYVSTRDEMNAQLWSDPVVVPGMINSPEQETGFIVTADELTAYFCSNRLSDGDADIFRSTRANPSAGWSLPTRIESITTTDKECEPFPTADGLKLIFGAGNGDVFSDIHWVPLQDGEPGAVVEVEGLANPDIDEEDPWLSPDERVVFVAVGPDGGRDIYQYTRP